MDNSPGLEMTFEGIIVNAGYARGRPQFAITNGKKTYELIYPGFMTPNSCARISGKIENIYGIEKLAVLKLELLNDNLYSEFEKAAEDNSPVKEIRLLVHDMVTERLKPKLTEASKKLYSSRILKKEIIVRFHNDGDGICGALSLSSFLKADYLQQNSAIYSVKDAIRDLVPLTNSKKSLLVLVDFGSNDESLDGLALIKAAGIEIIIIDHHPYSDRMDKSILLVNPWEFDHDESASKYTAGYLCSEIARILGNNCEKYARIALCSDKSNLLEFGQEEKNSGLVLNYTAAYSTYSNTLEFYQSVLENNNLFNSILHQAKEKIEELLRLAKLHIKEKQVNSFSVYSLNLGSLVKKFEFPGLGKSSTQIFELIIPQDRPAVLLCYGPKSIVLRLNDSAVVKGANATKIINHLKDSIPNVIESGGGHIRAAAIRVKEEFEKSIIEEIMNYLEKLS